MLLKAIQTTVHWKKLQDKKRSVTVNDEIYKYVIEIEEMIKSLDQAEAKSMIENNGSKIVSNVTKKLDYLVIGEKPTNKKVDLAKKNK